MKRFISMIVVLCCLISLCPMQAMAAGELNPPVVKGAYLSAPGGIVHAGDLLYLYVSVKDESNIRKVDGRAYLVDEHGTEDHTHIIFFSYNENYGEGKYDEETGLVTLPIEIDDDLPDGTYNISYLSVRDKYDNEAVAERENPESMDFSGLSFVVEGNSLDRTPPEILSVQMPQSGTTVSAGEKLQLLISTREPSGIKSVSGYAFLLNDDGTIDYKFGMAFTCYNNQIGEFDEVTGTVTGYLEIVDYVTDGTYCVTSLTVSDKYDNMTSIGRDYPGNFDFSGLYFTIEGTTGDREPPEITSIQLFGAGSSVRAGDSVELRVSVIESSEIFDVSGYAYLLDGGGNEDHDHYIYFFFANNSKSIEYEGNTATITARIPIEANKIEGTYRIGDIKIEDKYFNTTHITTENSGDFDLTDLCFTISSPDIEALNVSLPESVELAARSVCTITPAVTPVEAIPSWTWESEDPSVAMATVAGNGTIVQITGYKAGTTTITGKTSNGLTASTVVTVKDAPLPDSGKVDESYNAKVAGYVDIHPELSPIGATSQYNVTSDNPHVASVDVTTENNTVRIRGNNAGKAAITICGENGLVMTTTVIVGNPSDRQHEKETVPGYESTCIRHGRSDEVRCSACSYVFTKSEELPLADHKEEVVPGREATCQSTGTTDAIRCSVCGEVLKKAETIPMTDHTFTDWIVDEEPSSSDSGLRHRTCSVCGFYEQEEFTGSEPSPSPSAAPSEEPEATSTPEPTSTPETSENPEPTGTPEPTATVEPSPTVAPTVSPEPTPDPEPEQSTVPSTPDASQTPETTPEPESTPVSTAASEPTPTPTATQEPLNAAVGDQNINVSVEDGTASLNVSEEQLADAVENAAESGTLEVDISTVEGASTITLSQNIVDAVVENDKVDSLSLKTTSGDITLGGEALKTVAGTVTGEHDEINLSVKTIDPDDIPASQKYPIAPVLNRAVFIELSADVIHKDASGKVTGTDAIHEFHGDITVSVPYEQPENMKGRQVIACYIADDGSITYFQVTYKNGIATFTTRHFSTFAIIESYAAAFEDIDLTKWYMTSVEYALAHELMAGESDTLFAPEEKVSRAMAVQLLYNLSGQPEVAGPATFADVDVYAWYASAIAWAEDKAVVAGYSKDQFVPADLVTREQLATMLWQYAGRPKTTGSIDTYEDAADVSSWAKEALCWAVENGIMQGSANYLNPKATASRAEAAALMANLHQAQRAVETAD